MNYVSFQNSFALVYSKLSEKGNISREPVLAKLIAIYQRGTIIVSYNYEKVYPHTSVLYTALILLLRKMFKITRN